MNPIVARGSISRSSSRSISTKSTTKTSTPTKTSTTKPAPTKTATKPGSTVKTTSGKTVKTSSVKPKNSKYTRSTGVVGDSGYKPKFKNYNAPEGSVVYVPQHDFGDYIFWYYLFNHNSPRNDQATVVQPDNKQVTATPERGGVDGMFVLNWVILIIVVLAIIGGIVYLVNRLTGRKK